MLSVTVTLNMVRILHTVTAMIRIILISTSEGNMGKVLAIHRMEVIPTLQSTCSNYNM